MVPFTIDGLDEYQVCDAMNSLGWKNIARLQFPKCVHVCVGGEFLTNPSKIDLWVENLREAIELVRGDPDAYNVTAPIYGMSGSYPNRGLVR